MKYTFSWLGALVLLASAQTGCGSSSSDSNSGGAGAGAAGSGAACSSVAACGGDITGDWKITQVCPDKPAVPDAIKQLCAEATFAYGDVNVTGTVSYKTDKSFMQTSTATGTGIVTLGKSCLSSGGQSLTCAQLEPAFSSVSPTKCASTSDGGCACTSTLSATQSDTGTFTTSGTSLTVTSSKGGTRTTPYCVNGGALHLQVSVTDAPDAGGGGFELSGQLSLAKQ
jgi:hypothetical protein